MKPRPGRLLVLGMVASAALGALAPAAAAQEHVFIERDALRPPVLATTVGRRVTFFNRSGLRPHLEFLGEATGHRVFQVPEEIWAEFRQPGRHEYVIHFSTRREADLRGAIEVREDPDARPGLPECSQVIVMGECLEP